MKSTLFKELSTPFNGERCPRGGMGRALPRGGKKNRGVLKVSWVVRGYSRGGKKGARKESSSRRKITGGEDFICPC